MAWQTDSRDGSLLSIVMILLIVATLTMALAAIVI
jgi:hypothetical protein